MPWISSIGTSVKRRNGFHAQHYFEVENHDQQIVEAEEERGNVKGTSNIIPVRFFIALTTHKSEDLLCGVICTPSTTSTSKFMKGLSSKGRFIDFIKLLLQTII